MKAALAARIAEVVCWAYGGKHPENDIKAWTTERNIVSGTRTNKDLVAPTIDTAL